MAAGAALGTPATEHICDSYTPSGLHLAGSEDIEHLDPKHDDAVDDSTIATLS